MMYHNKLVAAVKVNGKILRENGSDVAIPFGSEYSILLKNMNSARVLVNVAIDGKDALDGTQLIIEPNSSLELERYIRNGNFEKGNRFKFIKRTEEIENHRGIDAADGLIRIEYTAERVTKDVPNFRYYDVWVPFQKPYTPPPAAGPCPWNPQPWVTWNENISYTHTFDDSRVIRSQAMNSVKLDGLCRSALTMDVTPCSAVDPGITVPGSESSQKFVSGAWFATESHSDVIVLRLVGALEGRKVIKANTVDRKLKCSTCGRTNKNSMKFCGQCGTALEII